MNYKVVLTIVGFAIAGAILYPMMKKQEAEAKRQEEEAKRKLDEIAEKALDEERRHMMAMEDIKKKGEKELEEMHEKQYEEMKELIERVESIIWKYNPKEATDVIHCMMKYKDKNGVIHEFDAANPKQLREVWKEKTNRLIFD